MRIPIVAMAVAAALAQTVAAQAPGTAVEAAPPVGTMSELMADVIYPTSDAVLYITTRTPATDAEWNELRTQTLMLAESGRMLMLPGRVRPGDAWMQNARAMYEAGVAAFRAAKAHDVEALAALNDPLYQSCVACHRAYRPDYGRGR
jgi:hypothetical protein